MARLDWAEKEGVSAQNFDRLVTDAMIDAICAIFIAGASGDCLERLIAVRDTAREQVFQQVMFSELGPDVDEAVSLLCDDIIPAL